MADTQVVGTVTDDYPLTVRIDGADTAALAEALDGTAYTIGDRVQMTLRNPQIPLVTGRVTTSA